MSEDRLYLLLEKFLFLLLYITTLWVLMRVIIIQLSENYREKLEKRRNAHELALLQAGGKLKQEETNARNAHEKEMYDLKNKC